VPEEEVEDGVLAPPVVAAKKVLKIPDDPVLARAPCPICRETFETEWSAEAQEWVWTDAEMVGGRVYHASCREDKRRADELEEREVVVLGKRKLEEQEEGRRVKIES
jgi:pre-mRNA cleavage complex 2 protein Pcf11